MCLPVGTAWARDVVFGTQDPKRETEQPRYDMRVALTDSQLTIAADMRISGLPALTDTLVFSLAEVMGDVKVEVLEPSECAGGVVLSSRLRPSGRSGWGTVTWTVRPQHQFPAHKPITLRVHATSKVFPTAEIFAVTSISAFAAGIKTAWYPQMEDGPEYQNGEPHGLRGSGRIHFATAPGIAVFAPGIISSESNGETLVEFPRPLYFTFAAGRYSVVTEPGRIPVSLYRLRQTPDAGNYARRTSRVLDALIREFGPFPQSRFAVMEVPTDQADRAGFLGASLEGVMFAVTDFLDRPFNVAYFGHEISHQWWPNSIRGNRQPPKNWIMSEGLAQYGSIRTVEIFDGPAIAATYRQRGYRGFPEASSAETFFRLAAAGFDDKVGDLSAPPAISRALVLSKGAFVWDMLSREVGRERFRRVLGAYARTHAGQHVGWDEFLGALAKGSDRDLRRFYDQWFYRTGAPTIQLAWSWTGKAALLELAQTRPIYRLSIPVVAYKGGRPSLRSINLTDTSAIAIWTLPERPDSITIDPGLEILRWTPSMRASADALLPYTRILVLVQEGRAEQAQAAVEEILRRKPVADPQGLRFMLRTVAADILAGRERWRDVRAEVRLALGEPSRREDALAALFLLDARAAKALGDTTSARVAVDSAIAADARTGGLVDAAGQGAAVLRSH